MQVVVWGDALGATTAMEAVGSEELTALVAAWNRPQDWAGLEELAKRHGVPVLIQPARRATTDYRHFEERLQRLQADLFLVNSYSLILPAYWLTWPRFGAVNVHAALLPQYRGANVLNWVLVNGESETGVTIHHLDAGIDTGDLILQERLPIAIDDTAVTLRTKLAQLTQQLLRQFMALVRRGPLPRHPQNQIQARYWPRRKPADGQIDWNWPAERIYNLIRALVHPWPGAYDELPNGERHVYDTFLTLKEVECLQQQYRNCPAA